jgi:hypothetical protein
MFSRLYNESAMIMIEFGLPRVHNIFSKECLVNPTSGSINRKQLAKELNALYQGLLNRIYNTHKLYSGRTSVSLDDMDAVDRLVAEFRERQSQYQTLASKFVDIAPEQERIVQKNTEAISQAIEEFHDAVSSVRYASGSAGQGSSRQLPADFWPKPIQTGPRNPDGSRVQPIAVTEVHAGMGISKKRKVGYLG